MHPESGFQESSGRLLQIGQKSENDNDVKIFRHDIVNFF